jgi:transcriptional regulator with XRE-family HTH domain
MSTYGHLVQMEIPHLTGAELRKLMRRHRVTIRALASRLGTTQRRVRKVRADGVSGHAMTRDWLEAITGVTPLPTEQHIPNL